MYQYPCSHQLICANTKQFITQPTFIEIQKLTVTLTLSPLSQPSAFAAMVYVAVVHFGQITARKQLRILHSSPVSYSLPFTLLIGRYDSLVPVPRFFFVAFPACSPSDALQGNTMY